MGQILSDEGNQEEAINCLIDALRWDSKNGWALLMMGNIFAKYKENIPVAMKYYDQAVVANPNDCIAVNNIGANLLNQGKIEEAKKYFLEALKINSEYANTHFALGLIANLENDLNSAFYSTIQAIKLNKSKDVLYQNSVKQAFEISKKVASLEIGKKTYQKFRSQLEIEGNTEIEILDDDEIPTAAKIEFAENYHRTKHILRFKSKYPAVEHLIMHELVHLDFVIAARKEEMNQLFVSNQQHKAQFVKALEPTIKKFQKMGISESSIASYCTSLFEGINRQIFNAPIDLFIEHFLYTEFPELRPYQFLSLHAMVQEGLTAVTDKQAVELSPKEILSKSKIFNLLNALQFRDLFGIDFIKEFNATSSEMKQAQAFYDEYLQYKDDKVASEEYELVLHWAQDLKLDMNFELVDENDYRTKRTDIDAMLTSIETDPFDLESNDPYKKRDMEQFQKSQQELGTNMAVVMFMVDALNFFSQMPQAEIKKVAFEIAMMGTQGYSPDQDNYSISSIPNKLFSGYHILAYYYVSWMLAMPENIKELGLPYEKEFELALGLKK